MTHLVFITNAMCTNKTSILKIHILFNLASLESFLTSLFFVYFIQLVQQLALMYFRMAEFTKANMKKEWPLEYI